MTRAILSLQKTGMFVRVFRIEEAISSTAPLERVKVGIIPYAPSVDLADCLCVGSTVYALVSRTLHVR